MILVSIWKLLFPVFKKIGNLISLLLLFVNFPNAFNVLFTGFGYEDLFKEFYSRFLSNDEHCS